LPNETVLEILTYDQVRSGFCAPQLPTEALQLAILATLFSSLLHVAGRRAAPIAAVQRISSEICSISCKCWTSSWQSAIKQVFMLLEYADAGGARKVRRRTSMPNNFRIARDLVFASARFCLAVDLHAEESHNLRLMPRINVGNADATVSAAVLQGWEAPAGFSLVPPEKP
jgi:hypothetical protein